MTLRRLNTGDLVMGRARTRGFSILELLIATTIAMVILLVVTKWFRDLSVQTARSRAMVEMSGQMRAVIAHLENDLRGATFPPGALPASNAAMGYIQYVEGAANDFTPEWFYAANTQPGPVRVPDSLAINAGVPAPGLVTVQPVSSPAVPIYFGNILWPPLNTEPISRFGDLDDVLSLTTRSIETPFRGNMLLRTSAPNAAPTTGSQSIESPMAEVVWWVEGEDENLDGAVTDGERRLHRRIFLIRPDLTNAINATWRTLIGPAPNGYAIAPINALSIMLQMCDVSFTIDPVSGNAVANSLADLANPTNVGNAPMCRRITGGVPSRGVLSSLQFARTLNADAVSNGIGRSRYGEDVMISSLAGFDARIFDPFAPLWQEPTSGVTVSPGDPGYAGGAGGTQTGIGAFVDLNYASVRNPAVTGTGSSWFSGPPSEFSGFFRTINNGGQYTHLMTAYDTWAPLANNSIDGVDNNGDGVIDEPSELMAEMPSGSNPNGQYIAAPYPFPIRGIQVTLRVYDPDSKQVRQMKASSSFTSD